MKLLHHLVILVGVAAQSIVSASEKPSRVILMVADGGGFSHFSAYSRYATGRDDGLVCNGFPVRLAVATFSAQGMGYDPRAAETNAQYVKLFPTDSAAAATAMATGFKTMNRSLGVDANGRTISNVVEVAAANGMAAGLVTTVPLSHATPAAFAAHCAERNSYADIAREMITRSPLAVLMGGGHPDFDSDGSARPVRNHDYVGGQDLWGRLQRREPVNPGGAWTLVQDRAAFAALATGAPPARVLGVAPVLRTLQQDRTPSKDWNGDGMRDGRDAQAAPPFGDPFLATSPTLVEMAEGALNVLSARTNGFFLMIEGGAVDWASHNNESGRLIEEMAGFLDAVEAVCRWVDARGGWERTLLIVTSDHETGCLAVGGEPAQGRMPSLKWGQKDHTNQLVPLFAKGAGAERLKARVRGADPVRGPYIDNTDIGRVLLDALSRP